MEKAVLGIDIGKNTFDATLISEDKIKTRRFSNNLDGFISCKLWLERLNSNPHICLEATGIYGIAFFSFMYGNRCSLSIVNPVEIKKFSESELT